MGRPSRKEMLSWQRYVISEAVENYIRGCACMVLGRDLREEKQLISQFQR